MGEKKYSAPRAQVTKYTIYPTGYDEAGFSDKSHFVCYVEQYPDTGRWRVHDGFNYGRLLSRQTGKWIRDRPLNRQWTRWDNAEEAVEAALKAVDVAHGRDLVSDWERFQATRQREDRLAADV